MSGANHDPNQMNMFGSLDFSESGSGGILDLPDLDEWDEKEKLRKEKESLGFYITGHPLDRFGNEIGTFISCLIQDLSAQKDKSTVKIAGVVENFKMKRTKRGDKMAVINLEDLTGSTEVVIFPDLFTRASPLLKSDDPLFITGSAEIGDAAPKIIAKEIVTLDSIRQKAIKAIELRIHEESISKGMLEDLRDITFKYPGECRIMFRVDTTRGKEFTIFAHRRFSVMPSRELINEIEMLTGNRVCQLTS